MKTLNDIKIGESAVIESVIGSKEFINRIYDLGFIKDTTVKFIGQPPFGNPKSFFIRNTVIAIRCEDLTNIFIK